MRSLKVYTKSALYLEEWFGLKRALFSQSVYSKLRCLRTARGSCGFVLQLCDQKSLVRTSFLSCYFRVLTHSACKQILCEFFLPNNRVLYPQGIANGWDGDQNIGVGLYRNFHFYVFMYFYVFYVVLFIVHSLTFWQLFSFLSFRAGFFAMRF